MKMYTADDNTLFGYKKQVSNEKHKLFEFMKYARYCKSGMAAL